jgi:hypothetical protein
VGHPVMGGSSVRGHPLEPLIAGWTGTWLRPELEGHTDMRFSKWGIALVAVPTLAGGLVLSALTATAATAGNRPPPTPTPTKTVKPYPTPTKPRPTPPPVVVPTAAQEDFDIEISSTQQNGYVLATGPFSVTAGRDRSISPTVDFLYLGPNGVYVRHSTLAGTVDRGTCSIVLNQLDQSWTFTSGVGTFRGISGSGLYDLEGLFSFPTKNFRCTIPGYVNDSNVAWYLNYDTQALGQPSFVDVEVQATGKAKIYPPIPHPMPTPTPTCTCTKPV